MSFALQTRSALRAPGGRAAPSARPSSRSGARLVARTKLGGPLGGGASRLPTPPGAVPEPSAGEQTMTGQDASQAPGAGAWDTTDTTDVRQGVVIPMDLSAVKTLSPIAPPTDGPEMNNPWSLKKHLGYMFDPHARVALPQGDKPSVGKSPFSNIVWSMVGAFCAYMVLGRVDQFVTADVGLPFMIGSWGTISAIMFGTNEFNPMLRFHNVIGGHIIAAFVVMATIKIMGVSYLSRAVAFSLMLGGMMHCGCVHPPGGAMVLIAIDSAKMQSLSWWYCLYPGLLGALFLMFVNKLMCFMKANFEFELPFSGAAEPKTAAA